MATPTSTKPSTSHDQTTDGSGDHGDELRFPELWSDEFESWRS